MTRDDIMQMTPEQLRLEIIKAKGWKKTGVNRFGIRKPGNIQMFIDDVYSLPDGTSKILFPEWPTNITAAWELVEEMRQADNTEVYLDAMYNHFGIHVFNNEQFGDEQSNSLHLLAEAHAETMPLAICRAYLQWKAQS